MVLLVDDDNDLRGLLTEVLEAEGYEVTQARNGVEAASHLRAGLRPCLMLLDFVMPVMNGIQFLALAREPGMPRVPVVVMTAWPDLAGDTDLEVIAKPIVDMDRFVEVVRRNCAGRTNT